MNNRDFGAYGEEIAVSFLMEQGYEIIEQNFRTRFGEIDIIASEDDTLVFIEVKTRHSKRFGEPITALTTKKIRQVIQMSQAYMLLNNQEIRQYKRIRVDAIGILLTKTQPEIVHVKNISV